MLRNHYGNSYPFPKSELPKWMVWLMAPAVVGVSRKMVANNMGYPRKVDYSKSLKALQMKYTPVEKSIVDFFNQMIESGAFKKK
jgi:dihydroflavonol-4-reductase